MGFMRCAPWMSMHVVSVVKGSTHQPHFNGWNNNKKNKRCFSESFIWKLMTLSCTTPPFRTSQSDQSIEIICSSHNPLWQYLSVDSLEFACEWGSNVYAKLDILDNGQVHLGLQTADSALQRWRLEKQWQVSTWILNQQSSCKLRANLLLQVQLCTHLHLYFGFSMVAFFFRGMVSDPDS